MASDNDNWQLKIKMLCPPKTDLFINIMFCWFSMGVHFCLIQSLLLFLFKETKVEIGESLRGKGDAKIT